MKVYKILRTDKAEEQLRDIIFYIADDSGNIDTALRYLEKIETAINRLQEFPNSGRIPRYSILKKQGYRVVIVKKHLTNISTCEMFDFTLSQVSTKIGWNPVLL